MGMVMGPGPHGTMISGYGPRRHDYFAENSWDNYFQNENSCDDYFHISEILVTAMFKYTTKRCVSENPGHNYFWEWK